MNAAIRDLPVSSTASDAQLVRDVCAGAQEQFAVLVRRYNQRVYRVARGIVRNDAEAEDIVQHSFVAAYEALAKLDDESKFAAWLTRIAVNESLRRVRLRKRESPLAVVEETGDHLSSVDPLGQALKREAGRLLEAAFDRLPEHQRAVYVMREVEELTSVETAELLGISDAAVRVRLFRARAAMREILLGQLGLADADIFPFAGARCNRALERIFETIRRGQSEAVD